MLNKIKSIFNGFYFKRNEKKFYNFITKKNIATNDESQSLTLIELSPVFCNIIGLFYFLKELRKTSNTSYVSYMLFPKKIWTPLLLHKYKKIYRKIGVSRFIYAYPDSTLENQIDLYLSKNPIRFETKYDLEKLEFNGVWVGDIIYDSYLRNYNLPTVDLNSSELKKEIREALFYYIFWSDFFNKNNVKHVIVSHTVYTHFSIISRISIAKGIETYQVNDAGLYRLSPQQLCAYNEFFDYKKLFDQMPSEIKQLAKEWAHKRLELRFGGAVGVDMFYSTKSAWTDKSKCDLILPSPRKKLFVALHCFFDSPHPYGVNLFPDFYEWLDCLGKISEKTDYDWYFKTHPDFLPGNNEIIAVFLKKYKKFKLIPSATSHHSIINSGIDFVLTVYGTVGMEYPYHGIPVINASLNNIHIAYNFNIHPKSVTEYEDILLDLENVKFEIPKEEILEYYFSKNYLCQSAWLWENPGEMFKAIGSYAGIETSNVLDYFLTQDTEALERKALSNVRTFLDSDNYCLIASTEKLMQLKT